MLNTIGLQNVGVEALVRDVAPMWATWQIPVIVNIAGDTVDEFGELAARLDGVPGVSGLELNISCPNVAVGGMLFGQDPKQAAAVTKAVLRKTTLPVIVKLTPNVTDIVAVARAVVDAGADALCLINTVQGMAIDVRTRRPVLSTVFGGLSGPAIKPIALRMVYQVAGAVDVPVVGCGGIRTRRGRDRVHHGGSDGGRGGDSDVRRPAGAAARAGRHRALPGAVGSEGYRRVGGSRPRQG